MTPTLSRQFPLSRLAVLRRAPFWAQALAVCALFAVVGVGVVDDYGIGIDVSAQQQIAQFNADYISTGDTDGLYEYDFRYYGVAFEMPLLLADRALGLGDSRHIFLMRHLLTHLLFIAGGFVCGMLAYRMFGSRWVALLAMLMFLLHPRLYAHSFFNSKDIPFAAMLAVALYLTHRAFRKDTLGAFLLCGIVAGLAINLRPFGLMLPPMILAMRGPDLWRAGKAERMRVLLTSAAFLAAALATAYIVHPYYWENPLRLIESVSALAQHPTIVENLFMGEIYRSDAVPWQFIPVWFAITAPPAALALGAVGCAAVCWQGVSRHIAALRDREIRFGVMLLGCVVLPVAVVIALQSNIYNDWRQMYFLWGPFCLLAAFGLHAIANSDAGQGVWKFGARLPLWVRGGGWHTARRALAYGAAGFGVITTLAAMVALHPYEYVYFNGLADTKTPGALAERYDMDYWWVARRQAVEYLLERYPNDALRVYLSSVNPNTLILPKNDRERIVFSPSHEADFVVSLPPNRWNVMGGPALYSIRAYGNPISVIYAPNSAEYRNERRAAYNDAATNGMLLMSADFDVYNHNGALYYLNANCEPPIANAVDLRFFLHIIPADLADLPAASRESGFENRDFRIRNMRFAFFDGKCIIKRSLPDYPIASIRTGEKAASPSGDGWRTDIDLAARAAAQVVHDSILAGDYGKPAAQSHFDLYLRDNALTYIKKNHCAEGDTDARFLLHIIPADSADLPADARERGFANLDFKFADHGARVGDMCLVTRELPDYAIDRIRAGQFVSGEGAVWRVEFAAGR